MNYQCNWEVIWIDNETKLSKYLGVLEKSDILSIDTETAGWQTGNEKLCLVQIGIPETETVLLIDTLAGDYWLALENVINKTSPKLIAHNASFEQRQFERHDLRMKGAVDTLKMARKLRPDLPNRTLKTCVKFLLDIEIAKEEQVSDWSLRPLSPEQLNYAAVDAEITYKIYEIFAEMEQKLMLPKDAKVPDLMSELKKTELDTHLLLKDIASQYELLKLRKEMLKEAIRAALIAGEPAYEGEYGTAEIKKVRRTEIVPQKVREIMPELAERAIVESVQKKRLQLLIEEYNYDKKLLEDVTELLRYDDRLTLTLSDF